MRTRCSLMAWLLFPVAFSLAKNVHGNERGENLSDWQQLLPVTVEGAFVGVSGDVLIVAGGCSGARKLHDDSELP